MRDMLPAFLIAIFVIATILFLELAPPESGAVIAVLGPNVSLRETVNATDAYLVGPSEIPNGYVLFSKQPEFPRRLKQAGAVTVLSATYAPACVNGTIKEPTTRWATSQTD